MKVKDCIAVVTGGASGLGEASIRALTGGGARAAIFDIQVDKGETLAKELGDAVIFINTDVTSEESVQAAIKKTVDAFLVGLMWLSIVLEFQMQRRFLGRTDLCLRLISAE